MANYYLGNGGIVGERADLGYVVPRWMEQFAGPMSQYVALRATGVLGVAKAGRITLPRRSWLNNPDLAQERHRRMPGEGTPVAAPHQVSTFNVTPVEHGQEVEWDDTDAIIQELLINGGAMAVDEHMTEASLARMSQALDRTLLAALTVASTPFDAADVGAGVTWATSATATPIANIRDVIKNIGAKVNAVILEFSYHEDFRAVKELTDRFGGNVGAGVLTDDLVSSAWASFGISNVFVADDASPLGTKAVLYMLDSSRNPLQGYCALIRATERLQGMNADGVSIAVRQKDHHLFGTYAHTKAAFMIDPPGGGRITGIGS